MPLWLQRLKSLDLLQTVQQFPSFPILVETYRDVLQDAFDMNGLKTFSTISKKARSAFTSCRRRLRRLLRQACNSDS